MFKNQQRRVQRCAFNGIALLLALPTAAHADWPRFLNTGFDGVATEVAKDIDWQQPPKLVWKLEVGDGYGLGVVADQRRRYLHFDATGGSRRGGRFLERMRSIDWETGQVQWSQSYPVVYRDALGYEGGPRSSPTADHDAVYTLGVSGILTCRSLEEGKQRWDQDTNRTYGVVQNFFGVGSSPLVLDDRLILMVGGSPAEDQQIPTMQLDRVIPNGTAVVALNKRTGQELWKCGEDLASYSSPRAIRLGDRDYVLVFARGGLLLVDPEAGNVMWRFPFRASKFESVNAMTPVVSGDLVLISECYELGSVLLRVTLEGAEVLWKDPPRDRRRQAMRSHWATPLLIDGNLYGCSGRNAPDSDFRCIDFRTGELRWADDRRTRCSITRVGDRILLLQERGLMQVVNPNAERLEVEAEWDLSVPAEDRPAITFPCWAAPVVIDDRILVRGDRQVLQLQMATSS